MAQPIYLDPELQSLEREKQLALALQQRGMQPVQGVDTGKYFVKPAWTQYLANLYDAYSGAQRATAAEQKINEFQNRQQQAAAQNVQKAMDIAQGTPAQTVYGAGVEGPTKTETPAVAGDRIKAMAQLLQGRTPFEQSLASELAKQQFEKPKYHSIDGALVSEPTPMNPRGEVVYKAPKELSPADMYKGRFEGWYNGPLPQGGQYPQVGSVSGGNLNPQGGGVTGVPMGGMGVPAAGGLAVPATDRKYLPKDIPQYEYDPNLSPKDNMAARAEFNKGIQTNIKNAKDSVGTIKAAVDILNSGAPSSGGIENLITYGAEQLGQGTKASAADAQLKILGTKLTMQQPRFEGNQSNADSALYQAAAGDIGNASKPIATRLAALDTMIKLNKKYYPNGDWDSIDLFGPVKVKNVLGGTTGLGAKTLTPDQFSMGLKGEDKAAFEWLRKNPFDPRAEKVRSQLGIE